MSDMLSAGEGYGRHWEEVFEEMEQRRQAEMTDRVLADRLCRAERPQETVDAVLDDASKNFEHCILFRIQDNVATVWGARGWLDQTQALSQFAESFVSGNPLELLTVHPHYRGTTPVEQAYQPFFEKLGLPFPLEISVVPVEVAGRIVAVLYGDQGEQHLKTSEKQDLELAERLVLGLRLVRIKSKIRGLGDA